MEASALLINLRITAMHGILLLCINHPSLIRKNEYFKNRMVPSYMKMLSEIDSISMEEWLEELDT